LVCEEGGQQSDKTNPFFAFATDPDQIPFSLLAEKASHSH